MKKIILAWLLICLLLCGCGSDPAEPTADIPTEPQSHTQPTIATTAPVTEDVGGAVRSHILSIPYCQGFTLMGNDILVFSDTQDGTQLTLLSGADMTPITQRTLDVWLQDQTASLRANENGLSYFDDAAGETVILDEELREVTRVALPENQVGWPVLSDNGQTLYYSTPDSIFALDLETRLPRLLRQYSGSELTLDGIHMDGSILKCSRYDAGWQTLFLSAENGQQLEEKDGWYDFVSQGDRYITGFYRDSYNHLLFGTAGDPPQILILPQQGDDLILLPESYGVLNITAGDGIRMDFYDLATGCLASTFSLEGDCLPIVRDGGNGILWLLVSDPMGEYYTLYRWDTASLPSGESTSYTDSWYSRSNPDLSGIAQCQAMAWDLGQQYGLEILVWEDALEVRPWDYRFKEEHLVPVLKASLSQLEQQLSHFPEGFFETLSEDLSGFTVCLVRQLEGNTDQGAVKNASGVQYWLDDRACIALSTVNAGEGSFYHELCHVMDTRIIAQSNAYDQWEALNPGGFSYDYDYAANANRNAGEYLRDAERCFIDTYSMSFPKEDRARILEYAMTEGNEHYFRSETMQRKLYQICIGIREAFGLKKSEETFLWEQYLQESLAYGK